jgi:hypothetical protein
MMSRILLPREAVIDRMLQMVNGMQSGDPHRPGYFSRERAAHALDLFKAAYNNPIEPGAGALAKNVSVATGLTYYDLRAPALNLYPTVTPLRNSIPRVQRQFPGDAAHWKAVTATTGSGFPYMGWVPEGKRSASMSYTVVSKTLPYATLGEEDALTEEARFASEGFEDEDALVQLRLLLKMFVKEEVALLGGNADLALGAPSAPSLSASGSGATLPAATYSVIVVALTLEGYMNSSLSGGVATTLTITGNDGQSYTLSGGSSNKSTNATQAVTLGQTLTASVAAVNGAVAYAWFVGTAGSETLQAITTINTAIFNAPLTGGQQAVSGITADNSTNSGLAFDGLLTASFAAGSNAYVKTMATVAGTGSFLTASGAGGIVEIDTMLKSMWDSYRISPTVIYVNSQELHNITTKVLTNSSGPLLRYNVAADQDGMVEYKLTAAGVVSFYFNPYTPDGGVRIPIKIHPNLPPGTLVGWAEKLPPWYISNEIPEVAVVQTRQDYYTEVWPKTTRAQYYGIYAQEALAVYAPFAMGVITNIGNG